MTSLVLASASPARLATLRAAGVEPSVVVSGVDESQVTDLPPADLALRLAELKCDAVAAEVGAGKLVLGCDSVLELGGAFVTRIEGDHHNVVGLSLPLLRDLMGELGHSWTELWRR